MYTIRLPRIRARYVVAACIVAIAAMCESRTPGLMQAILVVGANAQLPLESLAAESPENAEPSPVATVADRSERKAHVPTQGRPATQMLEEYNSPVRIRRERRSMTGYERSVTSFKYWT
ncbi:septal ring-binding cell division protein DamX [Paraburkholderia sp. Clong3]